MKDRIWAVKLYTFNEIFDNTSVFHPYKRAMEIENLSKQLSLSSFWKQTFIKEFPILWNQSVMPLNIPLTVCTPCFVYLQNSIQHLGCIKMLCFPTGNMFTHNVFIEALIFAVDIQYFLKHCFFLTNKSMPRSMKLLPKYLHFQDMASSSNSKLFL